MGSYDGAEVCELVGLFILNDLCNIYGKENIGLYRDDGLAVFKNITKTVIAVKWPSIFLNMKQDN